MPTRKTVALEVLLHVVLALPVALLLIDFALNRLTANPIEAATLRTGKTALVLLILSLACTPTYRVVRLPALLQLRRILGLYAFAYAAVHAMIFVGVDYRFDPEFLWEATVEKCYALAGLASFLLLVLPAITSFGNWSRRLGPMGRLVHRAVYIATLSAVTHYFWAAKVDRSEPLWFGAIVLLLLLLRLAAMQRAIECLRLYLERLFRRPLQPGHKEG